MRWMLFAITILLNVVGQFTLKTGMKSVGEVTAGTLPAAIGRMLTTPLVVAGVGAYALSVVTYLMLLSKHNLSLVYPTVVSCTFVGVCLSSALLLREPFPLVKIAGSAAILLGVWLVSMGS